MVPKIKKINLRRYSGARLEIIKSFKVFAEKLLEIHRNERCEAVSSREWDRAADTGKEREPNRRLVHDGT